MIKDVTFMLLASFYSYKFVFVSAKVVMFRR